MECERHWRLYRFSQRLQVTGSGRLVDGWDTLSAPFAERLFGHQQVTDDCLLGLAVREDGVLVTMDKAIVYLAGAKYAGNVLLLDAG